MKVRAAWVIAEIRWLMNRVTASLAVDVRCHKVEILQLFRAVLARTVRLRTKQRLFGYFGVTRRHPVLHAQNYPSTPARTSTSGYTRVSCELLDRYFSVGSRPVHPYILRKYGPAER